jgi:hypothetical protein
MRVNQPVTTVEHRVEEGGFMVSMTDPQSIIVNDKFCWVDATSAAGLTELVAGSRT